MNAAIFWSVTKFKRGGLIYDTAVFVVVFILASLAINCLLPGTPESPAVRVLPGLIGGYIGFMISRHNRKPKLQ
jgi:hypothetical protein